jgi:hypothetical protein
MAIEITDRDHHQSWVAGAAIAIGWLLAGVAILAAFAGISFAAFGPGVLQ